MPNRGRFGRVLGDGSSLTVAGGSVLAGDTIRGDQAVAGSLLRSFLTRIDAVCHPA